MTDKDQGRILIADEHTLVAEAIKALVMREFTVVGVVEDGRALVEAALKLAPELAIVDIALPKLNGLEAARRIMNILPGIKILFLTMISDADVINEAYRIGASAVIQKTDASSELVRAIRNALSRRLQIVPQAAPARGQLQNDLRKRLDALTNRERDVFQLLAEGLSMKEVASVLNVTIRTVGFHKYRIMQALDAHTDADLVQRAICGRLLFIEAPIGTHVSASKEKVALGRLSSLRNVAKAA